MPIEHGIPEMTLFSDVVQPAILRYRENVPRWCFCPNDPLGAYSKGIDPTGAAENSSLVCQFYRSGNNGVLLQLGCLCATTVNYVAELLFIEKQTSRYLWRIANDISSIISSSLSITRTTQ